MHADPSSRARLRPGARANFPDDTLFHRVARLVCDAGCLPRKELYEAWEVARRARRCWRGGRVVDLACGHGLLAMLMLVLDDTSKLALAVDRRLPPSASKLRAAFCGAWPRLLGRVELAEGDLGAVTLAPSDVVVSAHACGALTDRVLEAALGARARVAVLPCCHDASVCDTGSLEGWLEPGLAIDVTRAARLTAAGYRVRTQRIPPAITPKNRLLLAEPR
ncbi:MAG TPA: methyltransferase [Polyangiaceae bacterium]|nr:methyltransferase [Polyangiaceae bacterium]